MAKVAMSLYGGILIFSDQSLLCTEVMCRQITVNVFSSLCK
jgi:hypothetical protein